MAARRIVLIVTALVVLSQAAVALVPFDAGAAECGAAVVDAFGPGTRLVDVDTDDNGYADWDDAGRPERRALAGRYPDSIPPRLDADPCRDAARRRAWRAAVLAGLSVVGGAVAYGLLRPQPQASPPGKPS